MSGWLLFISLRGFGGLTPALVCSTWNWPDIPGLHTFEGRLFHTASYEEGYDLTGKRVAVIGSGSSGVQTVASVYDDVAELYTWVRSPTWITAGFAQKFAGKNGENFACKPKSHPLLSDRRLC